MVSPLPSSPSDAPALQPPLAVVTGAGSGIGRALVDTLLDRGHAVLAIDLRIDGIDPRAERVALDLRDADGMAALAQRHAGRAASHVFANAGIGGIAGDALRLPDAAWQWAWEVNCLATLRTLRLWWPQLCAGRGKAVATVSAAGLQSFPGAGPYRASKAALLAALEGLHYEAAGSGVAVHALCPGMVRSDICDLARYGEAQALQRGPARPPTAFEAYLAQAMQHAEPADAFARRVLDGLDAGDAPFYWLTHAETRAWIAGRHRAIDSGVRPFSDFAAAA